MSRVLYEARARIQATVRAASEMVGTSGVSLHTLTPTGTYSGLANPPRRAPLPAKATPKAQVAPWYRRFERTPRR